MGATPDHIDVLVRFCRFAAERGSTREILELLMDAALEHLGAQGAAVLEVREEGQAAVVAARGVPGLHDLQVETEAIGAELEARLLEASGGGVAEARSLPLVSGGDLFGVLVLFLAEGAALDDDRLRLATGLADLAAISLSKTYQYSKLARAFSELETSRDVLRRTERLRALGEMAAGVAHDLKNIFNPIMLNAELLARKSADAGQVDRISGSLKRTAARGVETVERLRTFGRQSDDQARMVVDPNALVREAIDLFDARIRERERIELVAQWGAPPPIRVEAPDLLMTLINLMVNAADAMPSGGTITVRTSGSPNGAVIEVIDDGPGIPEEVQRRLFEPFFTTKGEKGTGLGLAMAHQFVQRQGGTIAADSAPGRGTTFRLSFPRAEAHAESPIA